MVWNAAKSLEEKNLEKEIEKEVKMKRDQLKRLRLTVQTLKPMKNPRTCFLYLDSIRLEMPEVVTLMPAESIHRKQVCPDGTVEVILDVKRFRSDRNDIVHLKNGKHGGTLDYNYFKSRLEKTVVIDMEAKVLDLNTGIKIPMTVKKLKISFSNGKKVVFTNRISVQLLDRLAS